MASLEERLIDAAGDGDVAGVTACLAAGADVDGRDSRGATGLALASERGHHQCVAALLAAGADPNAADDSGCAPLHAAIIWHRLACVELLLAAGADPLATLVGLTAVEVAAHVRPELVPMLLQAVPVQARAARGSHLNMQVLGCVLRSHDLDSAQHLLAQCAPPPAQFVLYLLSGAGAWAQPLYATLASRQPLTARQWGQAPSPCDGLAAALPAVLQRSTAEAALLVQHLPAADKERLRTAALCLGRAQRQADAPLPAPILWHLLLQSVADMNP